MAYKSFSIDVSTWIEKRLNTGDNIVPAGQQTFCDITLSIGINDEEFFTSLLADAGQKPCGVGFAYTAF